MYKEIIVTSIKDEDVSTELDLRYFLEREKEEKTQTIIAAFFKHEGQTERKAKDMHGILPTQLQSCHHKVN